MSSKILPRIDPPLNFLPHLEVYVQFRPRDLPHDRKKRYSYPLIPSSCLVALVSLLSTHQTARIFFGNKENSCNIIDSFEVSKREKRYLRKTFSYFPSVPSPHHRWKEPRIPCLEIHTASKRLLDLFASRGKPTDLAAGS